MAESSRDRLRKLHEAILRIAERLDGLEPVRVNGDGHGGTVRYGSPRGSEALIDLRPERVSVTTRSADLNPDAGNSTIVDDLGIDLSEGYRWDDVSCESADELADLLVKHMRRRTNEADPEPLGGEARS
jgi:hypothetical protein